VLHDLRRTVRKALETRRERIAHDRLLMDPRAATEHDMARERSLDAGHGDCPYCS
jgi:hypothetical protein